MPFVKLKALNFLIIKVDDSVKKNSLKQKLYFKLEFVPNFGSSLKKYVLDSRIFFLVYNSFTNYWIVLSRVLSPFI